MQTLRLHCEHAPSGGLADVVYAHQFVPTDDAIADANRTSRHKKCAEEKRLKKSRGQETFRQYLARSEAEIPWLGEYLEESRARCGWDVESTCRDAEELLKVAQEAKSRPFHIQWRYKEPPKSGYGAHRGAGASWNAPSPRLSGSVRSSPSMLSSKHARVLPI